MLKVDMLCKGCAKKTRLEEIVVRLGGDANYGLFLYGGVELFVSAFNGRVGGGIMRLVDREACPDVMLLLICALTYLCYIISRTMDVVVWDETLPMLCRRLMAIEYLDVVEQVWCYDNKALASIGEDIEEAACAMLASMVLKYVDFLSTIVQVKIVFSV
ncbi:hypothetical protein DsansV1_C14g0128211 [Dioscorea sansibarensis]